MINCPSCNDTGMTYEGNGHRYAGYPYAEHHVAVSCSCHLGKALDAGERIPMPPVREVSAEAVAWSAALDVHFSKRLDECGDKWAADYQERISQPGYKAPAWFVAEQGEKA